MPDDDSENSKLDKVSRLGWKVSELEIDMRTLKEDFRNYAIRTNDSIECLLRALRGVIDAAERIEKVVCSLDGVESEFGYAGYFTCPNCHQDTTAMVMFRCGISLKLGNCTLPNISS